MIAYDHQLWNRSEPKQKSVSAVHHSSRRIAHTDCRHASLSLHSPRIHARSSTNLTNTARLCHRPCALESRSLIPQTTPGSRLSRRSCEPSHLSPSISRATTTQFGTYAWEGLGGNYATDAPSYPITLSSFTEQTHMAEYSSIYRARKGPTQDSRARDTRRHTSRASA